MSGRCRFSFGAVLDMVSWWAASSGNVPSVTEHISAARCELARGTDRGAVMRSLVLLFGGVAEHELAAATRSYLRSTRCSWSPVAAALGRTATAEVVMVSDLALFSLVDELDGLDGLLSSTLACVEGRITGEVSRLLEGRERHRAMIEFAEERDVRPSECVLLHRGDAEDVAASAVVGTDIDLRVTRGISAPTPSGPRLPTGRAGPVPGSWLDAQ